VSVFSASARKTPAALRKSRARSVVLLGEFCELAGGVRRHVDLPSHFAFDLAKTAAKSMCISASDHKDVDATRRRDGSNACIRSMNKGCVHAFDVCKHPSVLRFETDRTL
jgi:hypothetical protein